MFGAPLCLDTKQISAEIRWAVCYGYIAGKNGHVLQLSGLYVVSTRGAKTALRVQSMSHGKSDTQPGLPRKMYNLEWLGEQERIRPYYMQDELRVSEEAFDLLAHVTSKT